MRGGRDKSGKSDSLTHGNSLERNNDRLSPSRESKDDASVGSATKGGKSENDPTLNEDEAEEAAGEVANNKFWADEEAIRNNSLEPSYLPYYASFENEIIGQYGGSHPAGNLCTKPVVTVENATIEFLKKYHLGKVPILNDAECSPAKIMTRITKSKQILLMGEEERAWRTVIKDIHNHLSGATPEEVAMEQVAQEAEEDDEAKLKAIAKFLRKQMALKNGEIEQLEKEMAAATAQMQDKRDELQVLRAKYSIF